MSLSSSSPAVHLGEVVFGGLLSDIASQLTVIIQPGGVFAIIVISIRISATNIQLELLD